MLFRRPLALALLPMLLALLARAEQCKFNTGKHVWDLTPLGGTKELQLEDQPTPPTTTKSKLLINLCGEVDRGAGAEEDKCPPDTRVCLVISNSKPNEPDRVVSVIPVASAKEEDAKAEEVADDQLRLSLAGPTYAKVQQSAQIALVCDKAASPDALPTFTSYSPDSGVLHLSWHHPSACPSSSSDPKPSPPDSSNPPAKKEQRRGFFGWLFFLILLAIPLYFGLGAYYNYSQYGARGWDLVPHRDFWREVPFLLRDIGAHLCGSLGGWGGSRVERGGYAAV